MANTGPMASAAWLANLELFPKDPKWSVEIAMATADGGARFQIEIFAEEWGFSFSVGDKLSWIRVTDVPFVHGRDEHELLGSTPPLKRIGELLYQIERRHAVRFERKTAAIRTTIANAEPAIRHWIESL